MMVPVSSATDSRACRRAAALLGRKPIKVNLSVGSPETASAVVIAEGPGTGTTGIPRWLAATISS